MLRCPRWTDGLRLNRSFREYGVAQIQHSISCRNTSKVVPLKASLELYECAIRRASANDTIHTTPTVRSYANSNNAVLLLADEVRLALMSFSIFSNRLPTSLRNFESSWCIFVAVAPSKLPRGCPRSIHEDERVLRRLRRGRKSSVSGK